MAYQRQLFTRKRVLSIPNTAYPRLPIRHQLIRRIHQLDTTYRPFHSEQRIDLYSLNNVFVLPTNTAHFINSIWRTDLQQSIQRSVTIGKHLVEKFIQKFYQFSNDNEEIEAEEDDDPDDITDIFKIEGNLFNYETPLCKAFNDFNYLLKIDRDLFTFDIQGIRTYEEYELNNHVDKGIVEENVVDNVLDFHKLDYNVLVKLQERWWKINAHEVTPFTRLESYGQRPYANFKTEKTHDPYLDINRIFDRNYDTSNAGNIQDSQKHVERRDDPSHEPSVCKIKRFEMMKYAFNADKEYIAIKESKYLNHSKDNLDAYRELLRIIGKGWVVATPDNE
ncbi:hypothetical protein Tco_0573582 [Tanacetum coccineum]